MYLFNRASRSFISIFFKEKYFLASRRSELYGKIDFLGKLNNYTFLKMLLLQFSLFFFILFSANCGGLLGLFSGFSLISLVEIFYFLTFRLWAILLSRNQAKPLTTSNKAVDVKPEDTKTITDSSAVESPLTPGPFV